MWFSLRRQENIHVKTIPVLERRGVWGEDFIEEAGFKLNFRYTYQQTRIYQYHDSTLSDYSCLFTSGSGVNGEENGEDLSWKLEL